MGRIGCGTVVGPSTCNSLLASLHDHSHNILLSPTEDLFLRQSIRFIGTLVAVISLLERTNITIMHLHRPTYIIITTGLL